MIGCTRQAQHETGPHPRAVVLVRRLQRHARCKQRAGTKHPLLVTHLRDEENVRVERNAVVGVDLKVHVRECVVKRHTLFLPRRRAEVLEVRVADASALEERVEGVARRVEEEGKRIVLRAGVTVENRRVVIDLHSLDGVVRAGVFGGLEVERERRQIHGQTRHVEGEAPQSRKDREIDALRLLVRDDERIVFVVGANARCERLLDATASHLEGRGAAIAPCSERARYASVLPLLQRAAEPVEEESVVEREREWTEHLPFHGELESASTPFWSEPGCVVAFHVALGCVHSVERQGNKENGGRGEAERGVAVRRERRRNGEKRFRVHRVKRRGLRVSEGEENYRDVNNEEDGIDMGGEGITERGTGPRQR